MPTSAYDEVVQTLKSRKASLRCDDVRALLQRLGFSITSSKAENHKVVVHHGLQGEGFVTIGYACRHGKNGEVKSAYIGNILSMLEKYEEPLRKIVGEK